MAKSIQELITTWTECHREYDLYKKIQLEYFIDQTQVNLNKLRAQGKTLDHVMQKAKKLLDAK